VPEENRFIAVILTEFRGSYGGAWTDGVLSTKQVRSAVRAIAFDILSDQADNPGADLRAAFLKLEDAAAGAFDSLARGDAGTPVTARVRPVFKK